MIKALLAFFLALPASAQQGSVVVDHFGGVNNNDSSAVIENYEAQDALNVETNISGTALLKRRGFTREAALTVTTAPITGAHYFTDASGNNQVIVCHDRYCAKSTNGAAFTNFLSTAGQGGSVPTRWSFIDYAGELYGANDRRDPIFKYTGSALTYPLDIPRGSVLEQSQDRMVVGDTSANPYRVNYSQSGNFSVFTTGNEEADPFADDITSCGDKITGFKHHLGLLHIFKPCSINSCRVDNQFNTLCSVVSASIGTREPNSIVASPDGVYFRGQDGNYWRLDESGLTLLSQKISGIVRNQVSGGQRSNTQTSQADWEAGTQFPDGSWSTSLVAGAITDSSSTFVDSSRSEFSSGTLTNLSAGDVIGSLTLSSITFRDNFADGNFTANPVWTIGSGGGGWVVVGNALTLSANNGTISSPSLISTGSWQFDAAAYPTNGNILYVKFLSAGSTLISPGYALQIEHSLTTTNLYLQKFPGASVLGGFSGYSPINGSDLPNTYTIVRNLYGNFKVYSSTGGLLIQATDTTYSGSTHVMLDCSVGNCKADNFYFYSYYPTGDIVSRTFDTAFTTSIAGPFYVSMSSNTDSAVTFQVQESTDPDDTFSSLASVTPGARPDLTKRYWRYKASYTSSVGTMTASIQDVTMIAATTGTYRTSCIQPGSSLSGWGILSCSETNIGGGSVVYYATSAVSCATLPATAPTSWQTTVTNNATLSITTNTALYIGFRSLLGSATDQAQVDACTTYWNEGTVAQPVWGAYNSFNNSLYWTATTTGSSTGNRVLKYDLNNGQWYPFDLAATALRMVDNNLYFGSSGGGYWNKYGVLGVNSDNGSNINAYWKSKDFGGANPFQETSFQRISLVAKNQTTGSMTATHNFSSGQSASHTVSLSTTSTLGYIRDNYNVPLTSPHNFMNVQLGNNSGTYFEVLGLKLDFATVGWKPMNP